MLDQLWQLEVRSFRPQGAGRRFRVSSIAKPVSIPQLQSVLSEGESVVEYVLGSSHSFALVITRNRLAHYELKGRNEIEGSVDLYLAAIRDRRDGRSAAGALYRLLVEPLDGLEHSTRMIVVPDGKLYLLPFGALPDAAGRYLVERHVISYAPSATAYYLLSKGTRPEPQKLDLLGVGGARYASSRIGELESSVRKGGLFGLSPAPRWSSIPQSLREVTDLAAAHPGRTLLLTGDHATETDLRRLPLSRFRVLHFALHSAIDEEFPDRSALVLSSESRDDEDDLLQAREIVRLHLNADLVTLSACDAGAGTIEGIAGVNSLVQAFLMAGSRSVVASVWPADDMFTAALMTRFYAHLWQGSDKAEALTLAKRELLELNGPNAVPFFWAGFRLVGDSHGTVLGE